MIDVLIVAGVLAGGAIITVALLYPIWRIGRHK